ncbi:MAG: helix-turn-helix domain-containing protein [Proteobacteria bacterium]|nr:helix-turn-helix domain-containing protein [Pseudomonadota bacterium]MBU1387866.1 helix-turn-helix domain-containing protein [Pseudomonadota bacterium]MBU1541349.1 helix-turn-helix domain-containing protein [Pseudomonadota bacterium]MBU2482167.1 helix-turn-helix domain-containing protein [Pseudomonadota bacterium]
MLNVKEKEILKKFGHRLKNARLKLNDSQRDFAFRIGVSAPTLYKMEQGSPSVSIGTWIKALSMLGRLDDFDKLIAPEESLFDRYEALEKTKTRQRVRRQKTK